MAVDADLWSDICSTVLLGDRAAVPPGEVVTFAPNASWRSGGGVAWDTGEILAAYAWQKFVVKVSR